MIKRAWSTFLLAMLFALGVSTPTWANDEMHPGGRLFYPLWDVSTPNRLTFIVVTREALNEGSSITLTRVSTIIGDAPTITNRFQTLGNPGNCLPNGPAGVTSNVNRTDLGGTPDSPVFVDDVHFEYYGASCQSANEITHMSCSDIDLFLLASPDNLSNAPRRAFAAVAGERRGALEVHLIVNGRGGSAARKEENSLMGHAIISDVAEGWVASYPAASAKATHCNMCAATGGGTVVGYENYPMEVFLPFALADSFPTQAGLLRNVLSLWGPGLFPGANLSDTSISIDFSWWDGRERAFSGSVNAHSLVRPLGGEVIAGLNTPLEPGLFNVADFVCGHDPTGSKAENDGFPRADGTSAAECGAPGSPDPAHPSDNFEISSDERVPGHSIQNSTPIGWWRFSLRSDGRSPIRGGTHSGRGLVGVVLSSARGTNAIGVGEATRLWHKGSCKLAQSAQTYGPPHLRDGGVWSNTSSSFGPGDLVSLFNVFASGDQDKICAGLFTSP